MLGQPEDEEDELNDNESQEEIEDEEEEEFQFDWMQLAEMGPNTRILSSSDLGSRDMDQNHDWINDAK